MQTIIYQIGRLDKSINDKKKFKVGEENIEAELSSFALKKYLSKQGNNNVRVRLFYPLSLAINTQFKETTDDFWVQLANINKTKEELNKYKKKPEELYKKHPHSKYSTFTVIPSFGKFKSLDNEIVELKSSMDDLVLFFFLNFVKEYISNDGKKDLEIYFDISSGYNPYIGAMLEAVRQFYVFLKLLNFKENTIPKIKLVYSDPILNNNADEGYVLYFNYELKYKVMFISPLTKDEIKNKLCRSVFFCNEENKDKINKDREKIEKLIHNYALTFSSIKNFTPLILYYAKRDDTNEIIKGIQYIVDTYLEEFQKNLPNTTEKKFKKDTVIKTILSLSFYCGLIELTSFIDIERNRDWLRLEKIKENFLGTNGLYSNHNIKSLLNPTLLGSEINKIEELLKNKANVEDYYYKLDDRLNKEGINDKTPINERNFLSHAGFSNTLIKLKKENGEIFLKYDTDKVDENNKNMVEFIKSFLVNYV